MRGKLLARDPGSGFDVTTTSQVVVAENPDRRVVLFTNNSDADITLSLGGTAVATEGPVLKADGGAASFSGDEWAGAISAIHAGVGNKVLGVVEV